MQALATPVVSILHQDSAFTFTLRSSEGSKIIYSPRSESLPELANSRPGTVFETGSRWQLVPAKLYRYEDRATYLQGLYPFVNPDHIGVITLPHIDAMGIFDRNSNLGNSLYSGNHIAELFIEAALKLINVESTFAFVFFHEKVLWLSLVREEKFLLLQSFRFSSKSDAVFYISAILDQYGIRRENCPLFVGGMISADSMLHDQLSIYFDVRDLLDYFSLQTESAVERLIVSYQHAMLSKTLTSQS